MAAQRKPTSGALIAAGVGLGVALVAGAITMVAQNKDTIKEELGSLFGVERKPAVRPAAPAQAAQPPAAAACSAADHRARRRRWLNATRSSDAKMSESALAGRYLALKASIADEDDEQP